MTLKHVFQAQDYLSSLRWYQSTLSKSEASFKILSLTGFAHTWCATLKAISLLSDNAAKEQPTFKKRDWRISNASKEIWKTITLQALYQHLYENWEKPFSDFSFSTLTNMVKYGIAKTRLRSLMVLISQGAAWNSQHLEAVVFMLLCKWDHGKVLSYLLEMELW